MPTIIEQGIHRLAVANLTHLSFFVRNFPIRDTLAPLLPLLKTPNVFIPRPLLDKDALTVFLVVGPSARVRVAIGVGAGSLRVVLAGGAGTGEEGPRVRVACGRDMGAEAGVEALKEVARIVVKAEGGHGDVAGVGFDGVVAGGEPKIVRERFGSGKG